MSAETKSPMLDLAGKVCLVTGSSRGIGRSMADGLLRCGADVMLSGRTEENLKAARRDMSDSYGEARIDGTCCNILDQDSITSLVNKTLDRFGRIDALICNAGGNFHIGPLMTVDATAFSKTMSINVMSNISLIQAVAPYMKKARSGSIVINSSAAAFATSPVLATYGVSKLAVLAVMRQLAAELGPSGINVNAVCPSVIRTEFSEIMWKNPPALKSMVANIPMGRIGETNDLQGITALLVSEAGRYINGQAISVCGGEFPRL